MGLCLVSDVESNWQELMAWSIVHLKGKGLKTTICKLAWWVTVYYIWFKRNAIIHAGAVWFEEQILRSIKKDVRPQWNVKLNFTTQSSIALYAVIGG
jgi:hypothetical protein